jgi:uncharacterized protein YueI
MSTNSPFPYTFIDTEMQARNIQGVFKLRFGLSGEKYFIFKGLKIANTVENLSTQIHRERLTPKEDSILFKVIAYIRRAKVTSMKVEVISENDNPVGLLINEYEALQAAKKDVNCLNTRFVNNEYFPNWLPQDAVNEFNKRLVGTKPTDSDKKLKRFLKNLIEGDEAIEKIIDYIKKHYKPGNRHENYKNIPKI